MSSQKRNERNISNIIRRLHTTHIYNNYCSISLQQPCTNRKYPEIHNIRSGSLLPNDIEVVCVTSTAAKEENRLSQLLLLLQQRFTFLFPESPSQPESRCAPRTQSQHRSDQQRPVLTLQSRVSPSRKSQIQRTQTHLLHCLIGTMEFFAQTKDCVKSFRVSCKKPIIGANPVPGPTMMIGA